MSADQAKNAFKQLDDIKGEQTLPDFYEFGSGTWACKDSRNKKNRDIIFVPPFDKVPILNENLPGDSSVTFKLSSGGSLDEGILLQKSKGYDPLSALMKSATLKLEVRGEEETLTPFYEKMSDGLNLKKSVDGMTSAFFNALKEFGVKMKFDSWEDLPED